MNICLYIATVPSTCLAAKVSPMKVKGQRAIKLHVHVPHTLTWNYFGVHPTAALTPTVLQWHYASWARLAVLVSYTTHSLQWATVGQA